MDRQRSNNAAHKRKVKYVAVAVGLVVLISFITFGLSRLKPAAASIDRSTVVIDTVKRGRMLREVRGTGTLIPGQVRLIAAPAEGRVERVLVQPGMEVMAGTVLVEIVNPQLEQEAIDIEYQIKAAVADYDTIKVRMRSEGMAQQAGTATAQSDFSQAQLTLDTDEALAKEGLIPALSLKISRVKVRELSNRLSIEQQRLSIGSLATKSQLASQQARIDQLRALSQLRRHQVASLRVVAGAFGILQQISVEVGQQVTPGMNLAKVADPTSLKAELKIAEVQAKDISLGQSASIDTRNGVVAGRVSRIDPSVRDGTVTIDVVIEGAMPQGARPDLSIDGTIELERLADVLYVSRPAFGQGQSMVGMFRVEDGGGSAVRVQVKLGRSSVTTVEVLEGLREGDRVIVSDLTSWDGHDHVVLK